MTKMSSYCKAYPLDQLRRYDGWSENAENARTETKTVDGEEVEAPRSLSGEDYLFVHEDYVVTDGIYMDENVIFDAVDKDWIQFCKEELDFEIPDHATESAEAAVQD